MRVVDPEQSGVDDESVGAQPGVHQQRVFRPVAADGDQCREAVFGA
jgi:hypothetical protein